jgi:anti-sigma B factor antagonist
VAPLLRISMKRAFDDVRLTLSGELDRSVLPALDEALVDAERRARRIVLDLSELSFIDGGGLRSLQAAGERAKRNGHELIVSNPSPWVMQLIELCELDEYFEIERGELTAR